MTYQTRDQWLATPLGADGRAALRAAIKSHDGWSDYRASRAVSLDSMTTADLIDAALALGVDIASVTGKHAENAADAGDHHKPRPHDAASVSALGRRYIDAISAGRMTVKNRLFVSAVFKTIDDKQDGRATEKQFATIARILDRAESRAEARAADAAAAAAYTPPAAVPAPTPAPAAPVAPATAGDPASQLAGLIAQLAGQAMNPAAVRDLVRAEIEAALKNGPVLRIEVKAQDGIVRALEGKQHPKMPSLLRAASARMADGFAPNIWISGPAGSGKTHSAKEVAKALGLPFHMHGAAAMSYELLGFIDAGGVYHRTAFRDAFEHGGVVLWDEIDAWDNGAMLAMKAALGNGQCRFPDATVKRHPDCIIIGCANTFGLGATADYVGRAKIDAALLSSFPVRLFWQYDEELEAAICGNPQWAARVQKARAKAAAAGLKVLIDPRASQAGAALVAAGATFDEAAAETYLANLTADQRRLVEG